MSQSSWRDAATRTERARSGLANERTALAWSRSALSLAAIGALFLRFGIERHEYLVGYPLGAAALAAAAAAWGYGNVIYMGRRHDVDGFVAQPRALRALGIATTLLSLAAMALAVLS